MNILARFVLLSLAIRSGLSVGKLPERQRLRLSGDFHCSGKTKDSIGEKLPDLTSIGWDEKIVSTRIVGMYLFYKNHHFNSNGDDYMEYVFETNKEPCIVFASSVPYISSLRYAGNPANYQADTITLYKMSFFQGDEHTAYQDVNMPSIAFLPKSVIVTGVTGWTMYAEQNYKGQAWCIGIPYTPAKDFQPLILTDVLDYLLEIKSIKYGCKRGVKALDMGKSSRSITAGGGFRGYHNASKHI